MIRTAEARLGARSEMHSMSLSLISDGFYLIGAYSSPRR